MSVKERLSSKAARVVALKDRITGLRKVAAKDVKHDPRNWRTHPQEQRQALRGLMGQIGFADACTVRIAREGDAVVLVGAAKVGDLVLIDGHLRDEEVPPDFKLPVVVTDLTEKEAWLMLATADPLSALAGQDDEKFLLLLDDIDSDSAAVQAMLADLLPKEPKEKNVDGGGEKFEILITCTDEAQQAELLERLMIEGVQCRSLVS